MPADRAPSSKLLGLVGVLAVCSLLSACGGSSGSDPANSSAGREEAALKFSRCMREHGVKNFPNPETSEGHSTLHVHNGPGGVEASPQVMEAAQKACQHYQEALLPKLTPQERVQREEAVQKFAACMRQHGIHLETSTGTGGGTAIRVRSSAKKGEGGPLENPAFAKAQEACSKLLPGGGPKGRLLRAPRPSGSIGSGKESESASSAG
jgi:hypothetical protein